MNFSVSEDVPLAWDHIISTFATMVQRDVELNNGEPISNVQCFVKRGLLAITYNGGSRITDAYALFAKEMSAAICSECALPSTRSSFGSPRCDDCD
jgi:hypothetical protein